MLKAKTMLPALAVALLGGIATTAVTQAQGANHGPAQVVAAAAQVDDATITSKVKSLLGADKEVAPLALDVSTKAGVVTVAGTAPSNNVASYILSLIGSVEGVKDIRNQLKIGGQ